MVQPRKRRGIGRFVAGGIVLLAALCVGGGMLSYFGVLGAEETEDAYQEGYQPGKRIAHGDVSQVEGYLRANPAIVESIAKQSWCFTHASVGSNLLSGLRALGKADAALYPLRVEKAQSPQNQAGIVYELSRGNPGAQRKLAIFEATMDEGWGNTAQIAMNKFCYIDDPKDANAAETLASAYIQSMQALEARYGDTVFVYTTMPITKRNEGANRLRQQFNQAVRAHCQANDAYLFDIADIEAHHPDGTAPESGVEALVSGYTFDGGHLNVKGQRRLAKAWYALAAAIAHPESVQ